MLVGHSYGAQAVSEAANFAKRRGILIPECTGLDPAGPSFDGGPPQSRITKDDCKLVTIIHSGAEFTAFSTGALPLRLGTLYKSGHCDYWVNCGHFQGLRCTDERFGDYFRRLATAAVKQRQQCAHERATLVVHLSFGVNVTSSQSIVSTVVQKLICLMSTLKMIVKLILLAASQVYLLFMDAVLK